MNVRKLKPNSHFVVFALLEDVVLGHAHSLHDHLHSLQVHVSVLRQVTLQDKRTASRSDTSYTSQNAFPPLTS